MKKKKPIKHSGGVARIYKVPPVKMALKDVKSLPVQAASTRKERIMTNYIEVGSGTKVSNKGVWRRDYHKCGRRIFHCGFLR